MGENLHLRWGATPTKGPAKPTSDFLLSRCGEVRSVRVREVGAGCARRARRLRRRLSLFWRVFATNAAVLLVAGSVLSLTPATLPAPTSLSKVVVLILGLGTM